MSTKVSRVIPKWHGEVAAEINREFAETNELNETARRRRARLGLMLIWVKEAGKADGSIPHGKFREWMAEHCAAIPTSTAGDYITEANSICDLLRWQKSEIRIFEVPPHRLLTAKADDLSGADKAHQKELLKVIEQQKQFRAVTQYKQVEIVDDATVPKIGRRKGEGGKPPAPTGSVEEVIAANSKQALQHMGKVDQHLGKLGFNFVSQPDDVLTAWLGTLERSAKCAREWLNTPPAKRDPRKIAELWRTL